MSSFRTLEAQPADPLLAVGAAFRADRRPQKIDLGLGVYRTEDGDTPIMGAVKAAEGQLLAIETSKAYVGPSGDPGFVDLMRSLVFGPMLGERVVAGLQTAGGTAALRLAADLLVRAGVRIVHLGRPSWANHAPIFQAAGLHVREHLAFDVSRQIVDFDAVLAATRSAGAGEALVVQASCHNPTGADFSLEQWTELAQAVAARGVIPLVDVAYLGLAAAPEDDVAGARGFLEAVPQALIAVSCSKTFGLYRERTGALYATSSAKDDAAAVQSNLLALARANYSMPPHHGAAIVRRILETDALRVQWSSELIAMRARLGGLRADLAAAGRVGRFDFSRLAQQRGMFAQLPLSDADLVELAQVHAIHVAPGGRLNLAGMRRADMARFLAALAALP